MIHVHQLGGCAPVPLAHYLKALGILRLVTEQADNNARAWWDTDRFRLATTLTRMKIEEFFLYEYRPTPIVSPWNKGAGFLSENDPALSRIQGSTSSRFEAFRLGIEASYLLIDNLSKADKEVRDIKAEAKKHGMNAEEKSRIRNSDDHKNRLQQANKQFKQLKANLMPNLRLHWRGAHREWLDAAMVLTDNRTPQYPALLGTGGNDGRLDFTSNFMQRIGEIFDLGSEDGGPKEATQDWVSSSLWGEPVPGNLVGQPFGQYLPGTAGGANNGNGPDSESMVNPVDFILTFEGAIAFRSHAARRFESSEFSRAASPFVVSARGAAYASAAASDESARGEQWMPLWSHPATYAEINQLLGEGRAQVGTKTVREPLDLARAVGCFGTARGITAFQRYGFIMRKGLSNLAVPLGRFNTVDRQFEHLDCIDDLDLWRRRLNKEVREPNAPDRLVTVEKQLDDALFALIKHPQNPGYWQGVLLQLAVVEEAMAHGSGFAAQPLPRLRPEWLEASYDGTPEHRLGLAFALQASNFRQETVEPIDPIRRHWLPLDTKRSWRFATTGTGAETRLEIRPEVVMKGRRAVDDAIALVKRRLVEVSQSSGRYLTLQAAPYSAICIADLTMLLSGAIDLDCTLSLARTFMALDRKAWAERYVPIDLPQISDLDWPDDAWLAIRLCTLPWPLKMRYGFNLDIRTDPAIIRRLAAGDAASAVTLALHRLHAAGVRCTVRTGATKPETARLWAAALAFPITKRTARQFLRRLDPNKE